MALWIRDKSVVPEGGWRYPHVASGQFIVAPYQTLYQEIVKTYTANGATPPIWDEVVQWICTNLAVNCVEGNEPFVNLWTLGLPAQPPARCCGNKK